MKLSSEPNRHRNNSAGGATMSKILILAAVLFLSACGVQLSDAAIEINKFDDVFTHQDDGAAQFDEAAEINQFDDLFIHWDDGTTQFGSRVEGDVRVLYEINNNGAQVTQLAVFPSFDVGMGFHETEWSRPQLIYQLNVIGDVVILSAGSDVMGSLGAFEGDLFRVYRDGSGREALGIFSADAGFHVVNDWIYYFIWNPQEADGWFRFRADGTDMEYVGDTVINIFLFGDDGYIYGMHQASGDGSLARWQPDGGAPIVLFCVTDAPIFEDFNIRISYEDFVITDEHVYFVVCIFGFHDDDPHIGWRTPWRLLYTAEYRVDKDGGNLTQLSSEWH